MLLLSRNFQHLHSFTLLFWSSSRSFREHSFDVHRVRGELGPRREREINDKRFNKRFNKRFDKRIKEREVDYQRCQDKKKITVQKAAKNTQD